MKTESAPDPATATPTDNVSGVAAVATCSLFIGGAADGKRIVIPRGQHGALIHSNDGESHHYRGEILGSSNRALKVFVWTQITTEEALELLIQKYPANVGDVAPAGLPQSHCSPP